MSNSEKNINIETGNAAQETANTEKLEERALSVFSSERNEDLTALILCLITTFLVLMFTKWMV